MKESRFFVLAATFWLFSSECWAVEDLPIGALTVEAEFPFVTDYTTSTGFGFGSFWGSHGDTLLRVDGADNSVTQIGLDGGTARQRGIVVGEGAVWVPDAGKGVIFKVDPASNAVVAMFSAQMLSTQGIIGAGEGSVWVVTAENLEKTLTRFDARTGSVEAKIALPSSAAGVMVAYGSVWVTGPVNGELYQIDPQTNTIISTTKVNQTPKLLTSGADSIWVLNLGDGTVQRIDPTSAKVEATIDTGVDSNTGEIGFGGGYVWVSAPRVAAAVQIDPATNTVVRRYTGKATSGLVRFGSGSLWIWTNTIQRLALPK
jgi:streptogramin lyase